MVMLGQMYKEIERTVKRCVIEEGLKPDECVRRIETDYELEEEDKFEVREMAKSVGKL